MAEFKDTVLRAVYEIKCNESKTLDLLSPTLAKVLVKTVGEQEDELMADDKLVEVLHVDSDGEFIVLGERRVFSLKVDALLKKRLMAVLEEAVSVVVKAVANRMEIPTEFEILVDNLRLTCTPRKIFGLALFLDGANGIEPLAYEWVGNSVFYAIEDRLDV